MLPKSGNPFDQDEFIAHYLDHHFAQFDAAGIYYLCFLGNDDLRILSDLFDETCSKYSHVVNLAQRKFEIEDYEFVGMNWIVDYPYIKCRTVAALDAAAWFTCASTAAWDKTH